MAALEQQLSSKAEELSEVRQQLQTSDQLVADQAAALLQAEVRGMEQGSRLVSLEAEVMELRQQRTEAVQGLDQQGIRMA